MSDERAEPEIELNDNEPADSPPDEVPVADDGTSENIQAPPLDPNANLAGEDSTDEPSVEEDTDTEPTVTEADNMKCELAEFCKDATPEITDDSDTEYEIDFSGTANAINRSICRFWAMVWTVAILGGMVAYSFHITQEMMTADMSDIQLLIMPREKWDFATEAPMIPSSYMAQRVIVVQTDSDECDSPATCIKLLRSMKRKQGPFKYNFLLSTDGCIYEALGWQEPSPLFPEIPTMVVAFIGDYEDLAPATSQLTQLQSLLDASEELNYLADTYIMYGRKDAKVPTALFQHLAVFDHWDIDASDSNEYYIDEDYDMYPLFENSV